MGRLCFALLSFILATSVEGSLKKEDKNYFKISSESVIEQQSSLEKNPVLQKFVSAIIPFSLWENLTGSVIVDILVNERGTVDSVGLINGLHPEVDSAVIAAVKEFVFSPAIAEGKPVPVIITFDYDLSDYKIPEFVNFSGALKERGTRMPVKNAEIFISFPDFDSDTSLLLPLNIYLQQISMFEFQDLEAENTIVTKTDSTGKFSFKSLPNGPVKIKVPLIGYEIFETVDTIFPGKTTEVTYRLTKLNYSDEEIVVYGKSDTREVVRRTISAAEMKKMPGFNGDAVKVVQALPGVGRAEFGGGSVRIRGAPTWDSRFYLDGIQIPLLYHFGGLKSIITSEALHSIDLYPGGAGVKYGNSIAGAIEITGRSADQKRVQGFADINPLDITLLAEGPVGENGSILASARRSYIGDILGYMTRKDIIDLPFTILPYYYDYNVRADIGINRSQNLFITLLGSKDELDLVAPFISGGSSTVDEMIDQVRQMIAFNMVVCGWNNEITENLKNSIRAAVVHGIGYGSYLGFAKWKMNSWQFTLRNETTWSLLDNISFTGGVELFFHKYKQDMIIPDNYNTFMYDKISIIPGTVAPYVETQYSPLPGLLLTSGLRYDYYPELGYRGSIIPEFWDYRKINNNKGISGEPSLRFGARYEVHDGHTVKGSLGTYNQSPQPIGLSTHKTFGNPSAPATKARQITCGYEWKINDLIYADIHLYHNHQWDIPDFEMINDPMMLLNGGDVYDDGKGRMYGMELMVRHDQSEKVFWWATYSLSRSERYYQNEKRWVLYDKDQTHNLQMMLSYRFPKEWQAGTRFRYISGNPYSPVEGSVFNATRRMYLPKYGDKNSERNRPFLGLDIRVDKRFVFDNWMMSVYLDLQNISWLVYRSPEIIMYNFDYTEKYEISTPFLPSFGVRFEF